MEICLVLKFTLKKITIPDFFCDSIRATKKNALKPAIISFKKKIINNRRKIPDFTKTRGQKVKNGGQKR